jgi:hypothetical protein
VTPAARLFLHCFTATTHFNTTVKWFLSESFTCYYYAQCNKKI